MLKTFPYPIGCHECARTWLKTQLFRFMIAASDHKRPGFATNSTVDGRLDVSTEKKIFHRNFMFFCQQFQQVSHRSSTRPGDCGNPQFDEDSDAHALRWTQPSKKPATALNETLKRLACIGCSGHVPHPERKGKVLHCVEWSPGSSLMAVSCGANRKYRSLAGVQVDHPVLLFSHPTASLH